MPSAVHVYSWGPGGERLWRSAFELLAADDRPHDALLEFVQDDSQDNVTRDAGTARQLLAELDR